MTTQHAPLDKVRDSIARTAGIAGREAGDVTLIAVSKTMAADDIRPVLAAGQRDFGENRVQEAAEKWPGLRKEFPKTRLHMIGQLQSNKAEDAAGLFDVIHSVDRASLVKALGKAMKKTGRRPDCFVQLDIGDEPQKGGCPPGGLPDLLELCRAHDLPIVGLMCIPPADTEAAPYFALMRKLAERHGLPGLSMGMSSDYETAIMVGATHVRVGTAIFGART
ncbi:YggS family pyridoxal phosphate-dependent enzyme [Pacificimonas sp. WHA3]|uniref:Pyridoxal phosphate homeostasis protein n=1 Tax=Pacificimonas pallii TaxID=2827236 RepID=A0ABS6SH18_9SPHN|nr:YggS family pyridoxal phosphate-dependent enzyme [Pacificimonas pallii]MBV7257712.1 YggS family pyridoxal phosphate-dependent enzyme [Pacificimonas pallii]